MQAKPDAPIGTARELATRLAKVRAHEQVLSVDKTLGIAEARGATLAGTQASVPR